MNILLEISPYIGVGPLLFGMNPADIERILGAPSSVDEGFLGEKTEYRRDNGILATYSKGANLLVELGFSANILELTFENDALFAMPAGIVSQKLKQRDGSPSNVVGFVVLRNLGVTLSGFEDEFVGNRAVTVFARGRWDDELSNIEQANKSW